MLHHVQATFVHLTSSTLDVLSSRCPPWASLFSFTCQTPPSVLYQLLVSLIPGALHAFSRVSHLTLSHTISWWPWHWVPSWYTFMRKPPLSVLPHLLLPHTRSPPGASPSLFMCKSPPVISNYLLVSLTPAALHAPSHAWHLPPSQTISWCPRCQVASQNISMFLHVQASSLHSVSPPGVLGTACPPRTSPSSFTCK